MFNQIHITFLLKHKNQECLLCVFLNESNASFNIKEFDYSQFHDFNKRILKYARNYLNTKFTSKKHILKGSFKHKIHEAAYIIKKGI